MGRPKQEKDTGPSMMRESGSAETGKRHWMRESGSAETGKRHWMRESGSAETGKRHWTINDERQWVGRNRKKILDHQ